MAIGITFDKGKAEYFVDRLNRGAAIECVETTEDMLALIGACRYVVATRTPTVHPGTRRSDLPIDRRMRNRVRRFISNRSCMLRRDQRRRNRLVIAMGNEHVSDTVFSRYVTLRVIRDDVDGVALRDIVETVHTCDLFNEVDFACQVEAEARQGAHYAKASSASVKMSLS